MISIVCSKSVKYMVILLSILADICFGLAIVYLVFSVFSAMKVGRRHFQPLIFLEFQPHRARGTWEAARAALMMRLRRWAVLGVLIGLVSLAGYVLMS
jgi:hypothetical protein